MRGPGAELLAERAALLQRLDVVERALDGQRQDLEALVAKLRSIHPMTHRGA